MKLSEKFLASNIGKIFFFNPQGLEKPETPEALASQTHIERYELTASVAGSLVYILLALILIGILWAAVTQVDIVAEAPGRLIPQGDVKGVAPAADGIVEVLFVREGQHVKPGQLLLSLDKAPYINEVTKHSKQFEINKAELEQHLLAKEALASIIAHPEVLPVSRAEINNTSEIVSALHNAYVSMQEDSNDYSFASTAEQPSDLALLTKRHRELSQEQLSRKLALAEKRKEYKDTETTKKVELLMKKSELESSHLELQKLESMLSKTRQQSEAYRKVFDQGAVSLVDYLNVAKQVEAGERDILKHLSHIDELTSQVRVLQLAQSEFQARSKAELAQQEAAIRHLAAEIASTHMQIRGSEKRFSLAKTNFASAMSKAKDALAKEMVEIAQVQRRGNQLDSELKLAQHILDESELKATVAGVTTNIKVRGQGQVVRRGEELMTVVPANITLIVEAKLPNKDAGFVEPGQPAKLKFAAFPYQDYGIVDGKVTAVEQHPEQDQSSGSNTSSFYRVHILPTRHWVTVHGRKIPFASGMEVTSEIVVRKKSILNILLEPIKNLQDTKWS